MDWLHAIFETIVNFFTGLAEFLKNARAEIWEFLTYPVELLNAAWEFLHQFFYYLINQIILVAGYFLKWCVGILPNLGSFHLPDDSFGLQVWKFVNWFIPMDFLFNALVFIIAAIVANACLGIITRWLKVTT